jgi:poly-gamma-glutamate capsule biosynthesis protein CapA/YwtB (metallophosphatase superfamily)
MLRIFRVCWLLIFMLLDAGCESDHELSIIFGGDVMLDRGIRAQINSKGISYFTDELQPEFSKADYAIVNLECPATDIKAPLNKKFTFRADPVWLSNLHEAGITHCIMANNHSYDQGRSGLISTAENIERAGIIPTGFGQTQKSACEPVILNKNGIEVAIFSSVTLPLESWMYLADSPGMCQATIEDLKQAVLSFRAEHPATFIIVTLHWGVEYLPIPTSTQRMQATELIESGTDAIIGHHPHVVQTYERIKGKPVFYSIGNLIFDNPKPITHRGILVKFTLKSKQHTVTIIPYEAVNNKPFIQESEIKEF